ncbi:pseudouridine synthase [Ideonella sp. B508-1]|uniref:pseudouridine synthase n=1 Tax=Ideonella sp. B508-1 TaxID=137716 RepID=UPI0003B6E76E|nr:pseudouridine synthase [Ideonella sp. B508-1]
MRSDRNIQRPPRRATAQRDTGTTPAQAPAHAGVKVSYAEPQRPPARDHRDHQDLRGGERQRQEERPPRQDRPLRRDRPERAVSREARPWDGPAPAERRDRRAAPAVEGRPGRPPRPDRNTPSHAPARARHEAGPDRSGRGPQPSSAPTPATRPSWEAPHPAVPAPARVAPADAGVRLSKVMTERGLASRREADEWIDAGWVKVNGQMATLGQRVTPDVVIEVDPAARQQQARRVTVLLHKPIGYVSGQAEDGYEPASVLVTPGNRWTEDPSRKEFHPGHARGLAPAGRLDIDSTGLLVLTQDGRIAKHLIGDDSEVEKEYLVRVQYTRPGQFPEEDLKRLNHGLELDGVTLRPAKVSWANEDQLRFVLREGRKRQIRRMCELVGLKVVGLKRVRIGSVVLGKLPLGQWRYLRDDERF